MTSAAYIKCKRSIHLFRSTGAMSLFYSPAHFLITVLLLGFFVRVQLAVIVGRKTLTVTSRRNAQGTSGYETKEPSVHFFSNSLSEPNKWKIFNMWSCNSPEPYVYQRAAPCTRVKASGGNTTGIVLFGGSLNLQGQVHYYGTWYYDMGENLWQQMVTTANMPQNRKDHLMLPLCHTDCSNDGRTSKGYIHSEPLYL